MSFTTTCPRCFAAISVPDTAQGRRGRCKSCGQAFIANRDEIATSFAMPAASNRRGNPRGKRSKRAGRQQKIAKVVTILVASAAVIVSVGWGGLFAIRFLTRENPEALLQEALDFSHETAEFARRVTTSNAAELVDEAKWRAEEGRALGLRIEKVRNNPELLDEWNRAVERRREEVQRVHDALFTESMRILEFEDDRNVVMSASDTFWIWTTDWQDPCSSILAASTN